MNIEELKLILATVQAAGQGAYTLAIMWFAVGMLKYVLGIGLGLIAVILAFRILRTTINAVSFGGKVLAAFGSDDSLEYLSTRQERAYLEQIRNFRRAK